MDTRFSKGTILAKQLVREVKNAPDTPSLISALAGDRSLLQSVLRILDPTPSVDADFIEQLDEACRQGNLSLPGLKRRLEPAAAALGISTQGSEPSPDFYDILNVPSSAPDSVIRNAYRSRAREWHPDTNPEVDSVHFVRLTEAYRVLSNPELREQYDARRLKTPYWVEQDYARETANQRKIQMRRQRRRTLYQLAGVVIALLAAIVVTDFFFKEQALRDGPRLPKPPVRVELSLQPAAPGNPPDPALEEPAKASAPKIDTLNVETRPAALKEVEEKIQVENPADEIESIPSVPEPAVQKPPETVEPTVESPVLAASLEPPEAPVEPPVEPALPNQPPALEHEPQKPLKPIREPQTVRQNAAARKAGDEVVPAVPSPGKKEVELPEVPTAPLEPKREKGSSHSLERIEQFLASYCGAYQDLNYDRFMGYFTGDAMENDHRVKDLEPRYQENFKNLQDLAYHIDVDHFVVRDATIDVSGEYVLRWRFKNKDWRRREGPIFLSLVQVDEDYRVKRLVYH